MGLQKELKYKLIFFHHSKLFVDEFGKYWISSSIGIWLNELSKYFDISLLLFTTEKKRGDQDIIINDNINLINLKNYNSYTDFFKKRRNLYKILKEQSYNYDYLLIRGHTPLQIFVWFNLEVKRDKIFYLVRSIEQNRVFNFSNPSSILGYITNKLREYRFNRIVKSNQKIITNSKSISKELSKLYNKKSNKLEEPLY